MWWWQCQGLMHIIYIGTHTSKLFKQLSVDGLICLRKCLQWCLDTDASNNAVTLMPRFQQWQWYHANHPHWHIKITQVVIVWKPFFCKSLHLHCDNDVSNDASKLMSWYYSHVKNGEAGINWQPSFVSTNAGSYAVMLTSVMAPWGQCHSASNDGIMLIVLISHTIKSDKTL